MLVVFRGKIWCFYCNVLYTGAFMRVLFVQRVHQVIIYDLSAACDTISQVWWWRLKCQYQLNHSSPYPPTPSPPPSVTISLITRLSLFNSLHCVCITYHLTIYIIHISIFTDLKFAVICFLIKCHCCAVLTCKSRWKRICSFDENVCTRAEVVL